MAGVRTPRDIDELKEWLREAHTQLMQILRTLEAHYRDMQDTEFTVEEGRLYMLQTRSAKRPAHAAVRFAVDAVDEGLLTQREAITTLDAGSLAALPHPTFDPEADYEVLTRGVAASPGAAKGAIVFTAEDAVAATITRHRVRSQGDGRYGVARSDPTGGRWRVAQRARRLQERSLRPPNNAPRAWVV